MSFAVTATKKDKYLDYKVEILDKTDKEELIEIISKSKVDREELEKDYFEALYVAIEEHIDEYCTEEIDK